MNIAFAYTFQEAMLWMTGGCHLANIKYVGQVSTIMRVITNKGEESKSYCGRKNGTAAGIVISFLKQILIGNQQVEANKGEIKGQLPLEHLVGICKTFMKVKKKQLRFHLTFKMAGIQDIIYTKLVNGITVTINVLNLFIPTLLPDSSTQVLFRDSIEKSFTLAFDSWPTDKIVVNNGLEFQVDIGSSHKNNSLKHLIAAHQTLARVGNSYEDKNKAVFDIIDVRNCFCGIDGIRS